MVEVRNILLASGQNMDRFFYQCEADPSFYALFIKQNREAFVNPINGKFTSLFRQSTVQFDQVIEDILKENDFSSQREFKYMFLEATDFNSQGDYSHWSEFLKPLDNIYNMFDENSAVASATCWYPSFTPSGSTDTFILLCAGAITRANLKDVLKQIVGKIATKSCALTDAAENLAVRNALEIDVHLHAKILTVARDAKENVVPNIASATTAAKNALVKAALLVAMATIAAKNVLVSNVPCFVTPPIAAESVAEVTVRDYARETDAAISALAMIVPKIVKTQLVELSADVMLCG